MRRHLAYVERGLESSNLFVTRPHHYRESVIIRRSNEHNLVSIGTQDNSTEGIRCDLSRSGLLGMSKTCRTDSWVPIRREPPAEIEK
jgi:hypothetical protein